MLWHIASIGPLHRFHRRAQPHNSLLAMRAEHAVGRIGLTVYFMMARRELCIHKF